MPKIGPNHLASKPKSAAIPAPAPSPALTTTTAPKSASSPPPASATAATIGENSEPYWLTSSALKAANEHTFATQRAKKAGDRAKGKAPPRNVPGSIGGGSGGGRRSSSSTARPAAAAAMATTTTMTSMWAEVWDVRKMSADDLDWPELPTPLCPSQQRWSASPAAAIAAEYALRPTQDREVPLSALIRPIKARGAKAKGEGEFEFLPPVKNVIALDDAESNVPDEPWEYISSVGGDDEARKIFSYAEIVSKSA